MTQRPPISAARKAACRRRNSRALLILAMTVTSFLVSGVIARGSENPASGVALSAPPLAVVPVTGQSSSSSTDASLDSIIEPVDSDLSVQAVLSAQRRAVISSGIDARISRFKLRNGDKFKKGDVLIQYDCAVDEARLKEAESRTRATKAQLEAYEKLKTLESASEIELVLARETHEQNLALADQIRGRLKFCTVRAPFDGRVTNKMASQFEFAQTGRVLMDIASADPLRAEFLVPSRWLRWLNINTPVTIAINETGRNYQARITAVHGEVDPVSQSIQVVAEMESYHEELLPGMSGQAIFDPMAARSGVAGGFLGLQTPAPVAGDDSHGQN